MNYNKTSDNTFQITFPQTARRSVTSDDGQQGHVILQSLRKGTMTIRADYGGVNELGLAWDASPTYIVLGYFAGDYASAKEFAQEHLLPDFMGLAKLAEEDERYELTK